MREERVDDLARAVAAFGLPNAPEPERAVVSDEVWRSLLAQVRFQRITGLAVAAVQGGVLRARDDQRVELVDQHRNAMAWALAVERTLLSVAGELQMAGVPFVLLKGAGMAHALYPDPSWRAFGDADLLVRVRDWGRACAVFEQLGFPREIPEPRRGFDERFGKAAVFASASGVQVDLHRRLVLGPFGLWMDPEELFDRTVPVVIGGRAVSRLQDTELLLHACMHASLGSNPPLLVPLRDVLQVAWAGDVDWLRFGELTRRWRLRAVVGHAFRAASRTLRAQLPAHATEMLNYEPPPKERRLLEAYTTARRGHGGLALATLAAVPSIGAKVAYVRALLLPDREFLAARTGTNGAAVSYLRRWRVPAHWVRARRG